MADNARKTAFFILNELDKGQITLDAVMENFFKKSSSLTKQDRSFINALVYGVLRWKGRIDWIIGHFSKISLSKIKPKVLNILRLGLFQIIFLDKIPVFAAVNTSVEMAKSFAPPWAVKFINALLRNAARSHSELSFSHQSFFGKDLSLELSVQKSFPKWITDRWLNRFGFYKTALLCDFINTIPPITVRTNTLRTSRIRLMKSLKKVAEKVSPTIYSSAGIVFYNPKTPISDIESFKAGCFQVQDEAAQLVTSLLNPQSGETILDACSGMGGKTGHIGQLMQNKGMIVAMDNKKKKLLRLESEMSRLGISIVNTFAYDLNKPLDRKYHAMFDRILLDAPCSGLGVIRRNPDIKWSRDKHSLTLCSKKQIRFLNNLAHLVKPSGILVYAVCSTEPEENEFVADTFLKNHPEFVINIENRSSQKSFNGYLLLDKRGYFKTFPHPGNMDGFFSVCFKREK